jgi:hypothetical protein
LVGSYTQRHKSERIWSLETETLCISCPTGFTGFIFGLSPFPEGREKIQSACLPCGIQDYSTGAAEIMTSLFVLLVFGFYCLPIRCVCGQPFLRRGINVFAFLPERQKIS